MIVISVTIKKGCCKLKKVIKVLLCAVLTIGIFIPIVNRGIVAEAAVNEREAIVKNAESYLGVKYKFGGTNPATGLDCSALTQLVYRNVLKIDIGRTTWDQKVNKLASSGRLYDLVNAKPGDLYFWEGRDDHMGLATGNGNFIHASPTTNVSRQNIYNYPPTFYIRMNLSEGPVSKYKVGNIIGFNSQAKNWVGGKAIGADNLAREYKVSKINSDGTLYIVTLDNAWGGNVYEKDVEYSNRSKLFKVGEIVGFNELATTWTSGSLIGADNHARDYKVSKLNNDGTLYITTMDSAWGGNVRERDIVISKRTKKVKLNDIVGFNSLAKTWTSGKEIGEDNLIRDYRVTKLLVDGTVLVTTTDGAWSGLVRDTDIEISNRSKIFKVGNAVKFTDSAQIWTSGKAIGEDNLAREYFVAKLYTDGTVYLRTSDNSWGGNVYEKDIVLNNRLKINDTVRFTNSDAVWSSGKPIGADNLLRDYIVKSLNSDGTVYIVVPDNSWGGNVYYSDIDVKK